MNIRYLEILEAIEETGSFTGAARQLHLTQSAVSHAVAELERQANTALFDRLPRGVCLTRCGMALLEEARGLLAASRSLDQKLSHLEEDTPITIASSITIAMLWLPGVLQRLKQELPLLTVYVKVVSAENCLKLLEEGEADMALWEGAEPRGTFVTFCLGSYRLKCACSCDFSLPEGAAQAVSLEELSRLPLLLREKGSAIRDTLDSALALAHKSAYPLWESVNSQALVRAAQAGLGVTVLPGMLLEQPVREGSLRELPLTGEALENRMFAVLHREKYKTAPLKTLLKICRSSYMVFT